MGDRVSFLKKVFQIEFEEAEDDVLGLIDYYSRRFDSHEITHYVWLENQALLRKELSCVKELENDLRLWTPPEGLAPEKVLDEMTSYLKSLVKKRGYPELVILVIDRISGKLIRYLE